MKSEYPSLTIGVVVQDFKVGISSLYRRLWSSLALWAASLTINLSLLAFTASFKIKLAGGDTVWRTCRRRS
jgi:hypothetical protein